jgi:hypothetical protein
MKILYLTKGDHVDYQNDCLLIGLKELFGSDVVDYNKQSHNYVTYDEQAATKLYGMGMSVTRVLPDLEVDRTDITTKIKNKYFDYIIYGSIWRCNDYIETILNYYPRNKVIAVDGEDETTIHEVFKLGILYFKRELNYNHERLLPISFAIPTSKINFVKDKTRDIAICKPGDRSTYIYKNEKDYYGGYQESRIGITIKKAGWDCMRHYEILANGCLPYFINIDKCPDLTMVSFPKQLCIDLINSSKNNNITTLYDQFADKFKNYFLEHNTTSALAKYVTNCLVARA